MNFDEILEYREAVRSFSEKMVSKKDLEKIIDAGIKAPTAKNLQPFKIYVLQSDDAIEKIDKATRCRFNAKTVLLICGDKDVAYNKNGTSLCMMDATIALTHMMLKAASMKVDTIWIELFDEEVIKKEFNLPDNLLPIALMPIGYKTDDYKGNPLHKVRKSMEELTVWL